MNSSRLLFRYIRLNRHAKKDEDKPADGIDGDFPPLQDILQKAWANMPTVGERHFPPLKGGKVELGQRYVVLLRQRGLNSGAMLVRLCVYTAGEYSGFAPQDLAAEEASVSYKQVVDTDGQPLAPGIEFSAILFGRVALIQSRNGASSARAVQLAIYRLGHKLYKSMVTPVFVQVRPANIQEQINDAGGIEALSFSMADGVAADGVTIPLNKRMTDLEDRLQGSRTRVRISAPAQHVLDMETALELFDNPSEEGLEGVTLHLKDRQTIRAHDAVLSKTVRVKLTNGVPDCDDIDLELAKYLAELVTIDSRGRQAVTQDGTVGDKIRLVMVGC